MNNEFEKLEVFYLQSTFIKDCCDYIKSRDDYSLVKNIRNLLKIDTTFNKQDLVKVKEFYENYFKVKDIVYYPQRLPMSKYFRNKKIAVINLIGRVDMNVLSENPFIIAKKIIEKIKNQVDIIVVDFHAEATAEKIAMGNYLDGKATIVYGTHTHVQTADEQILPKGTGYISDIGMTGPKNSVIGMDIKASIKRFETTLPERYRIATGECKLNGVIFDIDDETNKVKNIERIK